MSAELDALAATFRRGTSRAEVPTPGSGPLGQALGQVERPTPEETLLARAALSGLYVQAGAHPAQAISPAPVYVEGAPDDRPPVPLALLKLLPLVQPHPALLHEWLTLTSAAGFVLTAPQALSLFPLNDGGTDRLSAPLWTLLDDHARWLARLNPDWKKHDPAIPPDAVHLARLRRALVKARAENPETSAADLLARWPGLKADERRTVLNVVAANLHPADLPLLELAREDRLEDVRRQGRLLMGHLPGELADQTRAALKAQLQVTPKGKLKYVPGDVPTALRDPKPPKGSTEEPDLVLLIKATPLGVIEGLYGAQVPDLWRQLRDLQVGGNHYALHGALQASAAGETSLDTLASGYTSSVEFWPQARVRARLWEAVDRLIGQSQPGATLMNVTASLLARLDGPLDEMEVAPHPRPGLLQRLKQKIVPEKKSSPAAKLHALFARVMDDAVASPPHSSSSNTHLLTALIPHLDPQTSLPALAPAPPAPKSSAKTPEEAQKEANRREQSRLHLEQTYADLRHQLDLRRQMHALIEGAHP